MKRTGGWRAAVLGAAGVLAAMGALAGPAGATDDLDGYEGDEKGVTVETQRTYDEATQQTTFTFTLATNGGNVSHVLLMTCPGIDVVSASGPPAAKREAGPPKQDPSIEGEHVGIKFEPGAPGPYTIVFAGNIAGAEFVVKDGTGHKHFTAGSDACQTVTAQTPDGTPETSDENPGTPTTPESPGPEPGSNQDSQPGTEVQGATATNDPPAGAEVLGSQLTQPDVQANLPRTGPAVPLLAPIGALLVAFGGLVTAISRRP